MKFCKDCKWCECRQPEDNRVMGYSPVAHDYYCVCPEVGVNVVDGTKDEYLDWQCVYVRMNDVECGDEGKRWEGK